ncbi:MBL fold metallo-hydrolase [Rhodovulum sp. PH10]|uniref:MBL fold metallo-hydrolase n=1 Tax=Rhodovulum sp. PH10 TaxID=1187851 RepID=UPI00058BD064|nr:MBL fold metallo-hydrolase [Rhodovulum sp. PH10]
MTDLTRRTMLAGSAAGAAAGAAGAALPAHAEAAKPSTQAPGFYRYTVGDAVVTVVTDGARKMPLPEGFVTNADMDAVNDALEAAYMPPDELTLVFNPMVVNLGSRVAVIDTGNGAGAFAQSKGAVGQFHTNLAVTGLTAEQVDAVVISHFHGDHINGLVGADGKPAFPNAEVLVPEPEWAFWMDDGNAAQAKGTPLQGTFDNAKRVFDALGRPPTRFAMDKEVLPGLTAMPTFGHTPGHTSFVLASGSDQLLIQGDVSNHPALFIRHPGWRVRFDMDGAMAEKARRRLYDMAAADRLKLHGFHIPFPSTGHVEKDGDGYRFVPIYWNPLL